jgi:hypothetical protein
MTSEAHAHGAEEHHGTAHPPAEEDVIRSSSIVWVGVVSLIVFLCGALAAVWQLQTTRRAANPDGPAALPALAGQPKIGMVEQRLFENSNQGVAWREHARRRLESFGWVDEAKGVAHIPIDQAMDRVEKGERP